MLLVNQYINTSFWSIYPKTDSMSMSGTRMSVLQQEWTAEQVLPGKFQMRKPSSYDIVNFCNKNVQLNKFLLFYRIDHL